MKTKLRRSFSKIQRPRIAITRASMESQDFASTGELDVVRALKVRQTFLTNLQYDLCMDILRRSLRQSCNCKSDVGGCSRQNESAPSPLVGTALAHYAAVLLQPALSRTDSVFHGQSHRFASAPSGSTVHWTRMRWGAAVSELSDCERARLRPLYAHAREKRNRPGHSPSLLRISNLPPHQYMGK